MQQLQSQSQTINAQISTERVAAQRIQSKLTTYEHELATVRQAQNANAIQLNDTLNRLKALQLSIAQNLAILLRDRNDLRAQLRVMYEKGSVPYLQVLLSATSWNDFLARLSLLTDFAKSRQNLIRQVSTVEVRLKTEKQTQQQDYRELAGRRTQLVMLATADSLLQSKQQQALSQARTQLRAATYHQGILESTIRLTAAQIQQIKQEAEQAQALMQNASYVAQARAGLVSTNVPSVIHYAETFMGVPYVWGGTSPSGFDCSGFTQYVYAHFGINIYRTSEMQFAQGVPVQKSQLQPGDLVFFSTYAPGATHVGIYIGNGLMVDAQDYGVSIDNINNSYWGPKYLGARQFIK